MTATYGNVTGEYQALHGAAAVVAGQHVLVRVSGADAATFLDSLLSQELASLADGAVVRSLLLAPRGKLRALLWVTRRGDEFWLVGDVESGAAAVEDLNRFRLRVDAEIGVPEPVFDLIGPAAPDRAPDGAIPAPLGRLPRFFVIGAAPAGVEPAGELAYRAVRVEMGEPVMGEDVDEATIPQEAGLVAETVSFTKGCYLGQELVARIDSRGHVNRHLRGLVMSENTLPPSGAVVVHEGADVGTITSVAESLEVGAPIGLGLIRREVEPGTDVTIKWAGGTA
ncbi:MAG: hypothetical protein KJO17_12780, partial [Acidimicrobiia bacterium]|nr:hypothetical protein [Acidimicrobiia bacterium]